MLVYDLVDPQELLGFVRGIQQEQEQNPLALAQFLPNDNIDDIEYRVTTGQLIDEDSANIRAWDTESPIGGRQGVRRLMGELPPISKKIPLTEEQRLRKRALDRGDNQPLIDAIYDDVAKMARSVIVRVERLRAEALEMGSLTIAENGVFQTVDFGRQAAMDPAALAGANRFSDPTSDAVQILTAFMETYLDVNDTLPALGLTSTRVINALLRNTSIRTLLGTVPGGVPGIVTRTTLNQVLQAYNLPPLVAFDSKVRVDGVQERLLSDNKIVFVPPAGEPLGKTFFGTTVEALELQAAQQINSDQAPGLTAVISKTDDPVHTWTKAVAIALPVLINPDLTMVATVMDA